MRNYRMGPLNQFTFCRLCLCSSSSLKDIFDTENNNGYLVKEAIEDLLQYKVIRVHGCPWVTCGDCREKLNNFRLFKINCNESKMTFENRFPQQIFLMSGKINISTGPLQQPKALLFLPVTKPPTVVDNSLRLTLPPLRETLIPSPGQLLAHANGSNENEKCLKEGPFLRAKEHEVNKSLLEPKLEAVGIQLTVSSMDVENDKVVDDSYRGKEEFKIAIEETDVRNVLSREAYIEPSMGHEEDRVSEGGGEQVRGHSDGQLKHTNADPIKKESIIVGTEYSPMTVTVHKDTVASTVNENGNAVQILCGGKLECGGGGCPCPASSVAQVKSLSCGEPMDSNFTPFDELGQLHLPSAVEGDVVMKPIYHSLIHLETVSGDKCGVDPISSFENSISTSLANTTSISKVTVLSESSQLSNLQIRVSCKQQVGGAPGVRDFRLADGSGMRPYKCVKCSKKFERACQLAVHRLSHAGDPRPYKCPLCPRAYKNGKNQFQHLQSHYNVPQIFECEVCEAQFRFCHHLKRHKQKHQVNSQSVKENFPCKICGQVFKSRQIRVNHMTKHSGQEYPCTECDKVFPVRYKLIDHQRLHNNEKSFRCHVCGKGFNKPQYLRCHVQLHDKVKRHACVECGAKFAQYSALWQHRKWHQGNKKFVCEVCNKGFVLNCQLRQHEKRHTQALKRKSEETKDSLSEGDVNAKVIGSKEQQGLS